MSIYETKKILVMDEGIEWWVFILEMELIEK